MNAARLLNHYERIAAAPQAVARLRRFILNLAVRGKLVPQDPKDEPASELLERIAAEKARLVKAGEFREPRNAVEIKRDKLPFVPAVHWEWSRLIDIACPSYGFAFQSSEFNTDKRGMPLIRIRDISKTDTEVYYEGDFDSTCLVRAGDYLVGMDGNFNLRRWQGLDGLLNQRVMRINGWRCDVDQEFVKLPLQMVLDYLHGATSLTTVKHLSAKQVNGIEIPLPPLAEQHRIVAKVDELMALCARLEARRAEREATRDRVAMASLVRLNDPDPDPVVFRKHAAFAIENLTPLTSRRDQIKALRQTILNLAVRGKLVEQDPADEPAAELLERIAAEKARLVRDKKIRVRRARMPAICSDVPFDLPTGWSPTKIEQIIVEIQTGPFGSSLHQSDYQLGGTPVINPASIQNERIIPVGKMAVGPVTLERLASFKLQVGDIIMGRRGEMGRCAVVSKYEIGWLCGTGSLILRTLEYIYPRFLSMLIGSPFSRHYLGGTAVGTTMQNLNQTILLNLSFGIPPLAEQHRIVARVDGLMALCDRLEKNLSGGDDTRRRLLDALLHEVLPAGQSTLHTGVAN